MLERKIFEEAISYTDPAQRLAYLEQACAGDKVLRARIKALLTSHDMASEYLKMPDVRQPRDMSTQQYIPSSTCEDSPGGDPSDDDTVLSYLAPATRRDSLGRIGHYEVLQILGKGGFGIVFRAFDDVLQRVVAVKVLSPVMATTSPARKRFMREARSSAAVRHENVVQVYEVGETPLPYLVMEFIPGETLHQRLNRVGPVDVAEILRIGKQLAEGLAAAHATDLIHRDIKPGNILIEGGNQKVKITDFGLARAADDASLTQSGAVGGTPMYMAPEQACGEKLDHRADLFSLGSVLYQMVTGRPPFRADSMMAVLKRVVEDTPRPIREIIPETPRWLCDIIEKLHEKNRENRFQSARELADVLAQCEAQLQANSKVEAVAVSLSKEAHATRFGSWKWVGAAVLLPVFALTLSEAVGWSKLFSSPQPEKSPPGSSQPSVATSPPEKKPEPQPAAVVQREVRRAGGSSFTDADAERIALLAPAQQFTEVRKELRRLNPDFKYPGKFTATGDVIVEVTLPGRNISDLSPLRVLRSLRKLSVNNLLNADLRQLAGLKLTHLDLSYGNRVIDLLPLVGMPLEELRMQNWEGTDLRPLQGMPLKILNICGNEQQIDLAPLTGLQLEELYMNATIVPDLVPLKGMPLKIFHCAHSNVTDLTPLAGIKLSQLNLNDAKVADLAPLRGMPLEELGCLNLPITSLAPVRGMPLKKLHCQGTKVTDLSPIVGLPLTELRCDFVANRDTAIIRGIRTLETINELPVADFWMMVDTKEKK